MKKRFHNILFALAVLGLTAVALYSFYRIGDILLERHTAREMNESVREYVTVPAPDPHSADETEPAPQNAAQPEETAPEIDWESLHALCPDIIGWIYCADTGINYPVLQAADNAQYLRRLPDGTWNMAGSIFADYRNTVFSDENTLIYGHNMKDGSMFHDLLLWSDAEFAAQHPCISIFTPDASYEMQLFSARQVTTEDMAYQLRFAAGEKETWAQQCQQKSYFTPQTVRDWSAPAVTLSTCTADGKNRFVVQGFLHRTGS